jgi:hypothetical protein
MTDLLDDEGRVRSFSDPASVEARASDASLCFFSSFAAEAWAKIAAVYTKLTKNGEERAALGDMSVEQLMRFPVIREHLGRTITLTAATDKDFARKIGKYVDSREKDLGKKKKKDGTPRKLTDEERQEYWPLIKVVRIFVKAEALSTGAILVDLPGTADSNAGRAAIARMYMKNATNVRFSCVIAHQLRHLLDLHCCSSESRRR